MPLPDKYLAPKSAGSRIEHGNNRTHGTIDSFRFN